MASCVVILLSCAAATAEHLLSCVLVLLLLFCTGHVEVWRREGPALVRPPHSSGMKSCQEILTALKWGPHCMKVWPAKKSFGKEGCSPRNARKGEGSPAMCRRRRCSSGSSERPNRCQLSPLRKRDKNNKVNSTAFRDNIRCMCCVHEKKR